MLEYEPMFELVSCPDPTHFVEHGQVTYARFLGPPPYCLVGHFSQCSLSNHSVPESRRLIGNGVRPKTPANVTRPYSTKWVGSMHETMLEHV